MPAPTATTGSAVTGAKPAPSPARQPVPGAGLWPDAASQGDRPLVYVNGRMVPKRDATVSVYDHGLLYGDGVFEGIRAYRGKIFLCTQHIDRLYRCAEAIRLTIPVSRDDMVAILRRCVSDNGFSDCYFRLVVSRGYGTLGLDPRKCPLPGVICIADEIHLFPPEMYEKGMRVVVANRPKTPVACLDPRIKSLNYLNNILAKCEAIDYGCHEVLMLGVDGSLTEGSGDNVFYVKGGKLYTPPSEDGLLEGCTRGFVMSRLCKDLGVKCLEKHSTLDDVLDADEVFLTGTAAEIISVTQIDQHDGAKITRSVRISDGEGPLTKRFRVRFREIVTGNDVPEA